MDSARLDKLSHDYPKSLPHDLGIHRRIAGIALDSAAIALRSKADNKLAVARAHLAAATEPLTETQRAEHRRMTVSIDRQLAAIAAVAARAARVAYATELEKSLLDQRLNVTVRTKAAQATTLEIEYVLVNKVWAHEMSKNDDLFTRLRLLGFRRFVITDGYDDSWYWDLK
jgi:hypothetical protein